MKIFAVSDMHGQLDELDPSGCDIAVIAGDFAPMKGWGVWHINDQVKWINKKFVPWCEKYPEVEFIVIPGNHDLFAVRGDVPTKAAWSKNIHFLVDKIVEVKGLRIAGSSWIPPISGLWAFETSGEIELERKFSWIPEGLDVLITHTPPFVEGWNIDVSLQTQSPHFGSVALTDTIRRAKPRMVFCGHIHTGEHHEHILSHEYGTTTKVYNVSRLNEDYCIAYEPLVKEMLKSI